MVGREYVDVIPHVKIPVIYPSDGLWGRVDFYCYGHWGIHDIAQSELD